MTTRHTYFPLFSVSHLKTFPVLYLSPHPCRNSLVFDRLGNTSAASSSVAVLLRHLQPAVGRQRASSGSLGF